MDCSANSMIGCTAAKIATHSRIDFGISRLFIGLQQRCSRHNLSRLAITALHHVEFGPGLLHRVRAVPRQAFDRDHLLVGANGGHRPYAAAAAFQRQPDGNALPVDRQGRHCETVGHLHAAMTTPSCCRVMAAAGSSRTCPCPALPVAAACAVRRAGGRGTSRGCRPSPCPIP